MYSVGERKVGPRRKSFGPLQATWRMYNDEAVNLNEATYSSDLRPPDCAVADLAAPRGAYTITITMVGPLDPRHDRRDFGLEGLGTRLVKMAGH